MTVTGQDQGEALKSATTWERKAVNKSHDRREQGMTISPKFQIVIPSGNHTELFPVRPIREMRGHFKGRRDVRYFSRP